MERLLVDVARRMRSNLRSSRTVASRRRSVMEDLSMLASLYTAGRGMEAAEALHGVTARNLAHAHQPGFRRMLSIETANTSAPGDSVDPTRMQTSEQLDFSSGAYEQTGQPLDVAINGPGFFVVDGPQGPLYTRSGVFQLDTEGTIVTPEGLAVQGPGGPLQLPPTASLSNLRIGVDGTLRLGDDVVGQLELVDFNDPSRLTAVGGATFSAPDDLPTQPATATVSQGVRELSNVQPVEELVALITASRRYEAAQKALRTIDEATKKRLELN